MKFAEISAERRFTLGPVSVTSEEIVAFAENYDPQWFHTDIKRASAGPWDGLIASGWHTCGLAMQLVAKTILEGSESFGSPGLAYLKWPNPVRPGDMLTLDLEVLESRTSAAKPWLGILRWRWLMRNQDGLPVLDLEVTSMFKLGEPA
jgi:acyl dehydratase